MQKTRRVTHGKGKEPTPCSTFFDALDTNDAFLDTTTNNAQGRANAGLVAQEIDELPNQIRVSAVVDGLIVRFTTNNVFGPGTQESVLQQAVELGSVFVNIDPTTQEIIGVSALG